MQPIGNKIAYPFTSGSRHGNVPMEKQLGRNNSVTLAAPQNCRSSGMSQTSGYTSNSSIQFTPSAVSRAESQGLDWSQSNSNIGDFPKLTIEKGNRGEDIEVEYPQVPFSQGVIPRYNSGVTFASFSDSDDEDEKASEIRQNLQESDYAQANNDGYEIPHEVFHGFQGQRSLANGSQPTDRISGTTLYHKEPIGQQKDPRQIEINFAVIAAQSPKQGRPQLPLSPPTRKEKNERFLCGLGGKIATVGKKMLDGFEALGGAYLGLLDEKQSVDCHKLKNNTKVGSR